MSKKINISDLANIDDKFIDQVAKRLKELESGERYRKEYLTSKEVAKALNVGRQSILRYIDSYFNPDKYPDTPKLKAVKSAKQWLIKKSDLDIYLQNPMDPEY